MVASRLARARIAREQFRFGCEAGCGDTVDAVNLDDLDNRQIAIILSRARCVIGLTCIVTPSVVSRLFFGANDPNVRAITRFTGIRDLALGIGALTTLKEQTQDSEWLSMGAVSDMVDGVVSIAQPGLKLRARAIGVGALALGTYLLKLSRDLDTERKAAAA